MAIVDHLRSKGTDLATEGDRPYGNRPDGSPRAGYVWYHGRGFSNDDYRVISGGSGVNLAGHHVLGNPGAFNVSPIALTAAGLGDRPGPLRSFARRPADYEKNAGLGHLALGLPRQARSWTNSTFPAPATRFAAIGPTWSTISIWPRFKRTFTSAIGPCARQSDGFGAVHLATYRLANPDGTFTTVSIPDFLTDWRKAPAQRRARRCSPSPLRPRSASPRPANIR